MSTKRWVQRTAWSGLFLMSVFAAMQVEAQRGGGGRGGGSGSVSRSSGASGGSFSGGGGFSGGGAVLQPGQWRRWGFFSERCRQ